MAFIPREVTVGARLSITIAVVTNRGTTSSAVQDISGWSFAYAIKDDVQQSTMIISAFAGSIVDVSAGLVQFIRTGYEMILSAPSAFKGKEEMVAYNLSNSAILLTPPGGVDFNQTWAVVE